MIFDAYLLIFTSKVTLLDVIFIKLHLLLAPISVSFANTSHWSFSSLYSYSQDLRTIASLDSANSHISIFVFGAAISSILAQLRKPIALSSLTRLEPLFLFPRLLLN